MDDVRLTSIALREEGIELSYLRIPNDVRKNGLVWNHTVLAPHDSDYDDEIAAVMDAIQALLHDVLDDEDRAEPVDLIDPEEEPDDEH